MTTTVVKTIGTGGDYTTIQAWEDASPADLTSVDQVWEGQLKNQLFSITSGQACTFAGTTVDATRHKRLTTVAGASFSDNASVQTNALRYNSSNGAAITTNVAYGAGLLVQEQYVEITKIQIAGTVNSAGVLSLQAANADIHGNIFEYKKGAGGFGIQTGTIRNNLLVARLGGLNPMIQLNGGTVTFLNNTVVTPSSLTKAANVFGGNYTTVNSTNCAFFGCTALKTGSSTYNYTTCMTDMASPPTGCTAATYDTSLFQNITDGTHDYRPPSGSGLVDVGTTNSNGTPDIAGTSRPQGSAYDVGCWELVASGGNSIAVPAGSLVLTAKVPTISQSANNRVLPPAGSLVLTGKVPTVSLSDNKAIAVPAGSLTLTGKVPTVNTTQNNSILVPKASLVLVGLAPTVTGGVQTQVGGGGGVRISMRAWEQGIQAYKLKLESEEEYRRYLEEQQQPPEVKAFVRKAKKVIARVKKTGNPEPIPVLEGPSNWVDPVNELILRYARPVLGQDFYQEAAALLRHLEEDDEDAFIVLHLLQ